MKVPRQKSNQKSRPSQQLQANSTAKINIDNKKPAPALNRQELPNATGANHCVVVNKSQASSFPIMMFFPSIFIPHPFARPTPPRWASASTHRPTATVSHPWLLPSKPALLLRPLMQSAGKNMPAISLNTTWAEGGAMAEARASHRGARLQQLMFEVPTVNRSTIC